MTGDAHTRLLEGAALAAQLKALWADGAISDITYRLAVRALYGAATEEADRRARGTNGPAKTG